MPTDGMSEPDLEGAPPSPSGSGAWYDNGCLVILLLIVFWPVGLYGLWKNQGWSRGGKWAMTIGLLFFFAAMIGTLLAGQGESRIEPASSHRPVRPLTMEQRMARIVKDAMGEKDNWSGKPSRIIQIEKIRQVAGPGEGKYLVKVWYRADESLSADGTRRSMTTDAVRFFQRLFEEPTCSDIYECFLAPHLQLVDQYGQPKEGQVAKMVLARPVAAKINWQHMWALPERFENLLKSEGGLWLHPALPALR